MRFRDLNSIAVGANAGRGSCRLLYAALLAGACVFPRAGVAQFQDPTPDELKMTADPKAPGAAAVYLDIEHDSDDKHNFSTIYERIKILTEKGKELSTVRIPYTKGVSKVVDIQGRTIHADGAIVPLTVKPDDLVEMKTKDYQENLSVFTLPSVEVGSILEYRLKIKYDQQLATAPTYWQLQQPYFIRKEHFAFTPNWSGFGPVHLIGMTIPREAKIPVVENHGTYSVDLSDVPPIPDEDWMPPINTIRERAEFYYSSAASPDDFWKSTGNLYAKGFESFSKPSSGLKKAAASLVSPSDTDEQKARKIYAAIMQLDNTDFSRVKSEAERKKEKLKTIRSADDVWKNKSGTANELAMLYVALARAAGLKATPMWIASRNESIFDSSYLNVGQLTEFIVLAELGGKTVYLDPGQRYCPFERLVWTHTLSGGIELKDDGAILAITPAEEYKDNVLDHFADLTVDQQGNVNGTIRETMHGDEALAWRQTALENDPEEVKKQFLASVQEDLPKGVEASFDHFLGMDDYEANLIAVLKVTGSIAEPAGKYLILPGMFFHTSANHPFVSQTVRVTPIDVHFPLEESDEVDFHLPAGYAIEGSPNSNDLNWPGFATLKIRSGMDDGSLTVKRLFARNFTLLSPAKYADLHSFYLKLASADQQQIVLARAAAQKGN